MEEAFKNIAIALNTLSQMPMVGDNVDLMARAKDHLRMALSNLREEAKNAEQADTGSSEG